MNKSWLLLPAAVGSLLLVTIFVREANKVETPPIWFSGNQLDWEAKHYQPPTGADEVSTAAISGIGLRYLPWDKKRMVCGFYHASFRCEWEGEVLLARFMDGEFGIVNYTIHNGVATRSGITKLHPPLKDDPRQGDKSLRECLAPGDNGKLMAMR